MGGGAHDWNMYTYKVLLEEWMTHTHKCPIVLTHIFVHTHSLEVTMMS